MRRITWSWIVVWCGLLFLGLGAASAADSSGPLYLAAEFDSLDVDTVTVLPLLDARKDTTFQVEPEEKGWRDISRKPRRDDEREKVAGAGHAKGFEKKIHALVKQALKRKRYGAVVITERDPADGLTEDAYRQSDSLWVKELGPAGVRWVMVVCLEDLARKMTFGSTGNAEVSGALFDTETGSLLWRDKAIGRAGQGGLLGMAMAGEMAGMALEAAMGDLMKSLPKRSVRK